MPSPFLVSLLVLAISVAGAALWPILSGKKWDPHGRHCYVTGGSAGLGLSLAILLTKSGADVSIVARNQERLDKALAQLEAVRQNPNQILKAYSFSLSNEKESQAALDAACQPHGGRCPDAVFLCAGKSTPGFFVEENEATLRRGMDDAYWVQACSALAAAKRYLREGRQGKIVFISSILGYMSFVGYSSYSPAKHALRGLAETLRNELLLYGVDVHIMFPATIYSPGYEEENKTKPKVTLKIEDSDEGMQPDAVAKALLHGVERGYFHISSDFSTTVFRNSTRGSTPWNNLVLDPIYEIIGSIALVVWRQGVDSTVRGHREEHRKYLLEKGFSVAGASGAEK